MFLSIAFFLPMIARAQPPEEGRGEDRARTFLLVRLAEALDLTDEKALQVSRILRSAQEQRQQLRRERADIDGKLREALKKPSENQEELKKLISRAHEIDEQLAMAPERSTRELQKILSVEQQAKLVLLRPEMQHQVRQAIRRRMMEHGGEDHPWRRKNSPE